MTQTRLALSLVATAILFAGCRPPTYIPPDVRALTATNTALDIKWRTPLGQERLFAADPVERAGLALSADGRTVIAAVAAGDLIGLDSSTGDERWRIDVGSEPFSAAPVVHRSYVFIGAPDGSLRAYHADSGGLVWQADLGEVFNAPPSVDDELVVVSTASGRVFALGRESGQVVWEHERALRSELTIAGGPQPTVRDDQIFVGYPDGALGALDRSGNELWLADLGNGEERLRDVDTTPLVAGDAVFAASFSGGLHRVNRTSGESEWHLDVTGATSPLAVDESLVTTTAAGSILWIDPATGTVQSELSLDDDAAGRLVRAGDYLLVGEPHDGLYVLAASRPWIHARFQPDSGFSSDAVASGDTVFALSDAGFVYAFRLVAVGR